MTTQNDVKFSKLFQMFSVMSEVKRMFDLTARMRRVTLTGEGLRPLIETCLPADAVKLYLPLPGQVALEPQFISLPGSRKYYNVRPYTIRRFDRETLELDIDILLHGDSPGSSWARTVQLGDQIGFIGPRHDYRPTSNAAWQVLAGDESALPAIVSIVESLPANTRAYVFLEVEDKTDELPINTRADINLTWLHRKATPAKDSHLLEKALYNFAVPTTSIGYWWVAGYSKAIKNIRQHLLNERHLSKEVMFTMGYWS